jgi:hypothetical protein
MTAHKSKPTITPERVTWFREYHQANPAWGVFHVVLDDENWKLKIDDKQLNGQPDDVVEAARWFNMLTPSQRARLERRVEMGVDFPPRIRAAIDAARARLTVTHDADQMTIRIDGMSHGAWMVFSYQGGLSVRPHGGPDVYRQKGRPLSLDVSDAAANIRYDTLITGMEVPPWWEVNAAWETAKAALGHLPELPPAVHTLYTSRVTVMVASYLAMRERVQQWGGFTGERERLPRLLDGLTLTERQAVDDRLAGKRLL